ncbi:class I adenylate-forming enzyme family protein [Gemmatimonadota bacterium DH-20]|uniref:Class I adenylate-forming enzyme family protein n=1 Tax=Gaopeijia maritima TaxID=3119007 RepID=A0ABU9EBX2_9BACT
MALRERYRHATLASALAHRATIGAQDEFLIHRGRTWSLGEIDTQAEALAASLHGFGVEAGDRVALVLPQCPEFVVGLFAAARLGAVVVPLSPSLTPAELRYRLRHSEAVAAITVEVHDEVDFLERFEAMMPQLPELKHLVTVGEDDLWYGDRVFQWEDVVSAGAGRDYASADPATDPSAPLVLVYTAGTTGKPKAVTLSHANLLYGATVTADTLGLRSDDRVVGLSALHHVFGLGPGLLGCLLSGATLILAERADPGEVLDLVEAHGVTVLYGIPTLFFGELGEQERRPRNLSSLRVALAAGAPVPESLLRRVEAELCSPLLVAYSTTETGSIVSLTLPGDPGGDRRTTVGRPLAETRVRILEEGRELPEESIGEVAVSGPGVMAGYYRQPLETRESFDADGFFVTGDLGMVDEDGFLHLVGRRKGVIIRTGFNVYPREVEDRIRAHPAVHEVAVVGIPDSVLGEAICACVIPVEGAIVDEEDLRDWCRETLSDEKVPDLVRLLDRFPRTATGDVRKVELARWIEGGPPTGSEDQADTE